MKKNIFEEIQRFKMMVNYNPSNPILINEEIEGVDLSDDINLDIPVLKGKTTKSGYVNLKNTTDADDLGTNPIAVFSNKKFFPVDTKKLYLFVNTEAGSRSQNLVPYRKTQEPKKEEKKEEPKVIVKPFKINFSLEDPFEFNSTTLTSEGEMGFNRFIAEYNTLKNNNIDKWDEYINFLKQESAKTPFYVRGYASIDGNPEGLVACSSNCGDPKNVSTSTYVPCRVAGGRKRSDYNKCLSQARATTILKRLEKSLTELKGIFTPIGMGETTKFKNIKWPQSNDYNQTAPNRRFVLDELPDFNYEKYETENKGKPIVNTQDADKNKPEIPLRNKEGDLVEDYGPYESGDYIFYYCKTKPKSNYIIQTSNGVSYIFSKSNVKNALEADWTSDPTSVSRNIKQLCKSIVEGKTKKPDGYWKVGEEYGLSDGDSFLNYTIAGNSENFYVRKNDVIDVFGSVENFVDYVPFFPMSEFNGDPTPFVTVTTSDVEIMGKDGRKYSYKGWNYSSDVQQMVDVTVVGATEMKRSVVKLESFFGGEEVLYEIGWSGFSLRKPSK